MERAVGPRLAERLAAPRQGSRGGDGQSEEGNAEGAQQEAGSCRACPDAKAKGSPFCGKHKRAFQCIQGRCCKKNKEGFYVDPDAAADFHKIFGEGRNPPPNVTLANEVVLDFCIDNPDGKEASGKKRGGQLNLNKYVNRVYASLSQGRLEDDCLWDEEIFVNKFRSLRGWSQEHSRTKFLQLLHDPTVYKDEGGLGGTPRVAVPPSWTGEERNRRKREVGEQRALERTAKSSRISDQDCGQIVAELDSGFQFRDVSCLKSSASSWTAPLPAAAITNMDGQGAASAVQIVSSVAKKVGGKLSEGKGDGASGDAKEGSGATPPQTSPTKSDADKRAAKFDIERLKTCRVLDALMKDHEKKIEEALKKAWAAALASEASADDDLLQLLKERAGIAIHWLGSLPVGADASSLKMQRLEYDVEDTSGLASTISS